MQAGDLTMNTGFSPIYESFFYSCLYGCFETDFESNAEAERAFLAHTCTSAGIVGEVPC